MNQSVQPAEAVRPAEAVWPAETVRSAETVTEVRPRTRMPDPAVSDPVSDLAVSDVAVSDPVVPGAVVPDAVVPDGGAPGGLSGIPRQSARRSRVAPQAPVPEPRDEGAGVDAAAAGSPTAGAAATTAEAATLGGPAASTVAPGSPAARRAVPGRIARLRPWRLLPTPTGTPFTFGYALVLAVTSMVAAHADPDLVSALLRGSSTDVAHLAHTPVLVLVASALWVAGGITSPYAIGFLLVLTALERRIGALRAAGVFLLGHVLATLVTEVPVGLSVLAGHLPDSSLHRLDYGISFGVAASVGALAGLLTPWPRWVVLGGFGCMLLDDLIAFTDPMTNWGHLLALAIGVSTWPLLRRGRA